MMTTNLKRSFNLGQQVLHNTPLPKSSHAFITNMSGTGEKGNQLPNDFWPTTIELAVPCLISFQFTRRLTRYHRDDIQFQRAKRRIGYLIVGSSFLGIMSAPSFQYLFFITGGIGMGIVAEASDTMRQTSNTSNDEL